jgi:3-dehydroquinate dehydratase-1
MPALIPPGKSGKREELMKKTNIAAVIFGRSPVKDAVSAKKAGAGMLELRLDQFKSLELQYLTAVIKEIKKKTRLPLIATLRYKGEEKFLPLRHRISEDKRLRIISSILPLVNIVDIELRSRIVKAVISRAHKLNKKVIVSCHNFEKTPSLKKLGSIAGEAKRKGADIVKIAAFARSREDVTRLMAFTYLSKIRPLVTVSMGSLGSISRIIAPLFGSCITYAAITKKAAPGQLSLIN